MAKFEFDEIKWNWKKRLSKAVDIAIILFSAIIILLATVALIKGSWWIITNL